LCRPSARCITEALLAALLLGAAFAIPVQAATTARLSARFEPERLGGRTTLDFGFAFSAPRGEVPPPLIKIELRYPNDLGIGASELGLATCAAARLEATGPSGCPPNSVMGYGQAFTGIVLGTNIVSEAASIVIVRAPDRASRLALLFYAEGTSPVNTRIVFPGLLTSAPVPFGGQVNIGVPLVPTLPGAPYISVIHLSATIGPQNVTYYERSNGLTLAYRPRGILLPPRCPRAGFPFAAQFTFLDKSQVGARTSIACPDPKRPRGRRRRQWRK
jgi:hypothetical protein